MENCVITAGIGIDCSNLRRAGGLNKRLWLGNNSDLRVPISATANVITTLEFLTYASLYKFEGAKYAHSAQWTLQKNTDSGVAQFLHSVTMRIYNTSYQDDQILQDLAVAEVFAVVQTNNNEFLIYGGPNGLSASEGTGPTGKVAGDDTSTTITLTGNEISLPKRFDAGNVNATLALLEAYTA